MMRKDLIAATLATVSALLLVAAPAVAQNAKSFVGHSGNDNNTCADATLPCATLRGAFAKTNAGGEITIVDPGEYGPISSGNGLNKAITIDNGSGGEASITSFFGLAISAGPGDVVTLRGLTFEGSNLPSSLGIQFLSGLALHIENCVFRNFTFTGLNFAPSGTSQLFVTSSTFFNNGSATGTAGIIVRSFSSGSGSATVMLDGVHLDFNVDGLHLDSLNNSGGNGIHVVLRNSVVSANVGDGVSITVDAGKPPIQVFIDGSTIANNIGNGVVANGQHAVAVLAGSKITRNGTGVSAVNGGQIISRGDNTNSLNVGAEGSATSFLSPF